MKHIITAIDRAMVAHVQGAAAINELRSAALALIEFATEGYQYGTPDPSAQIVRAAAAVKAVPEATVDWGLLIDLTAVISKIENGLPTPPAIANLDAIDEHLKGANQS